MSFLPITSAGISNSLAIYSFEFPLLSKWHCPKTFERVCLYVLVKILITSLSSAAKVPSVSLYHKNVLAVLVQISVFQVKLFFVFFKSFRVFFIPQCTYSCYASLSLSCYLTLVSPFLILIKILLISKYQELVKYIKFWLCIYNFNSSHVHIWPLVNVQYLKAASLAEIT